jgi:hypothetical protein
MECVIILILVIGIPVGLAIFAEFGDKNLPPKF